MSGGIQTDLGTGNDLWPESESPADAPGNDSVFGNAGNDFIAGYDGNDTLDGGSDNDTLDGGNGDDSLDGGTGSSDAVAYTEDSSGVTINLTNPGGVQNNVTAGADTLVNIENVYGSLLNDLLIGDTGANTLLGSNGASGTSITPDGNDTLVGGGGADSLAGGSGSDSLVGGADATLSGGRGADTLSGSGRLLGDSGDDSIVGGDDVSDSEISPLLSGGTGNDTLVGGTTEGNLNGGNDADSIMGGNNNLQILRGQSGNDTLVAGVSGGQLVEGGDDADSLLGSDAVTPGRGERLSGGNGRDTLDGRAGDDTLTGGNGDDLLYGGDGNDFASYEDAAGGVEAALTGYVVGAAGLDALDGIEGLIGSNFADTLIGTTDANTLIGGDGSDSLISGGGTLGGDRLDYGAGDDTFAWDVSGLGSSGSVTLLGGVGNDYLNLGSDWVRGPNTGNDWINFQLGSNTVYSQGWEQVVCFAEGTRIVTPSGEDAVENLRAGDMVLAMRDGQAGFEALRWVGFMDVAVPRNAAMAAKTAPILIKAGAIAPGMPARDLRVSPDHAMEVDGHLIPAKHLVNGSSIIQEVWCKRVRYFHLELEAHGLLLSEGTWSESYLDDGNRHAFNNTALTGLFLDFEAGRSKGQYDDQACLPVLRQGLKLDEIHGRIALRAAELAQPAKGRRWG